MVQLTNKVQTQDCFSPGDAVKFSAVTKAEHQGNIPRLRGQGGV